MRGINHLDPLTDETALECRCLVKDNQPQASQVGGKKETNSLSILQTALLLNTFEKWNINSPTPQNITWVSKTTPLVRLHFCQVLRSTFCAMGTSPYEFQGTSIYPKTLKQFVSRPNLHQIAPILFLRDCRIVPDFPTSSEYFISARDRRNLIKEPLILLKHRPPCGSGNTAPNRSVSSSTCS